MSLAIGSPYFQSPMEVAAAYSQAAQAAVLPVIQGQSGISSSSGFSGGIVDTASWSDAALEAANFLAAAQTLDFMNANQAVTQALVNKNLSMGVAPGTNLPGA